MVRPCIAAIVGVVAIAAAAETAFVAPREALAGDAQVADTLFKSGRQAFGKGDFAGAIVFFTKAESETPELIEARWWRGSSQEKSGDKPAALASYREFLALVAAKSAGGGAVSKEEQRLKGLAEKSVEALAVGEKEFRKLDDTYVAALLALAKDNFVRDPGISAKAVEALLAVRPDHEEALKLREKLSGGLPGGGAKSGAGAKGPFAAATQWRDLIAEKAIALKTVAYADGVMSVEVGVGSVFKPGQPVDMGTSYLYEAELSVTSTSGSNFCVGLTFAERRDVFLAAFVKLGKIEFIRGNMADGSSTVLQTVARPSLAGQGAHRIGVVVKGPSVEIWFSGEKVASWSSPDGADLTGELGFFQQACRCEFRVLRAAKVD